MHTWQLQEAKARLSELIRRAHDAGALAVVATDPFYLCLGRPPGALL